MAESVSSWVHASSRAFSTHGARVISAASEGVADGSKATAG